MRFYTTTAPIVLRHRPACPPHVWLHAHPGRRDGGAAEHDSQARHVAQDHGALSDLIVMAVACILYLVLGSRLWVPARVAPSCSATALSLQAMHGGKAKNDTLDAQPMAV